MSDAPIPVDLIVRSDAPWRQGGDLVQIAEYAPYLADAGFDLREVPFDPAMRLRPNAIVHVFNVDRPFDFLIAVHRAGRRRLVVSPVHHSVVRVRAMRAADRGRGLRSLASRVLPEPLREWLGTVARSLKQVRGPRSAAALASETIRLLPALPVMWRRLGPALDSASAVALLAEGEGRALATLTGWRRGNAVLVPNGHPEIDPGRRGEPWEDRPAGSIVVVGRIEPRKRQLEVARAARAQGVAVLFVGPRTSATDDYTAEFDRLVADSPLLEHLDGLPRSDVLAVMGESRVLLNASWVEVQSLVDIEAAFMGCRIVGTDAGHSKEWLSDAVTEVPGGTPAALVKAAARAAASGPPPRRPPSYDWTWRRAAEELARIYRAPGPVATGD